ncbi:MAG TPA: hypothetical protein VNG90_03095 [Candidatus Acidoferrum sp.]|nr:hypothetical protein [Candidatus Acidoferrum sp.]
MPTYAHQGHQHTAEINGQLIKFDSNLEEKVVKWLVEHGYQNHWRRMDRGLNVKRFNYTPDLELALQIDGQTHRALVEIKPRFEFLSADIARRMAGVAKHYFTDTLLVYVDQGQAWYRLDLKTLNLVPTILPPPGAIPINKLRESWKINAKSVYSHHYVKRVEWEKWPLVLLGGAMKALLLLLGSIVGPSKPTKRPYKRKRN